MSTSNNSDNYSSNNDNFYFKGNFLKFYLCMYTTKAYLERVKE